MAKHAADGKIITINRKARHDYFVLEAFEAGIELTGTEVKSIRAGGVNLKDSFNKDPFRVRRLLMHKSEISRLYGKVKQEGLTLIPLSLYFKKSNVKVELGLCKGKQLHDKRADMAERDAKREIDRALKSRQRG